MKNLLKMEVVAAKVPKDRGLAAERGLCELERFEAGLKNLQKSIFLVVYLKLSVRKLRLGVRTFKCTLDGLFVKLDVGRTNARCGNANVALTWEEALKSKLTTIESSAKVLQGEIEHLKKESSLFKVNAKKPKEKLKTDLNKVEAEILKTHEVGFFKATRQAKYFLQEVNLSLSNIDKDVNREGELVPEAEVDCTIEEPI
ncbi:hypothetical protein JHK87_000569 [Glycine soja]|nr:hypothetical protein JHK87_000569 [Glycine soja]